MEIAIIGPWVRGRNITSTLLAPSSPEITRDTTWCKNHFEGAVITIISEEEWKEFLEMPHIELSSKIKALLLRTRNALPEVVHGEHELIEA